jgi:ABC-2 type transport system permease protein
MKATDHIQAIYAEFAKVRHTRISWATFVAFALGPIMGGVFLIILSDPSLNHSPALTAKAAAMSFSVNWNSYIDMLAQVVGVGGVLVFGFVASWVFGREYSDRTVKDLLAMPVSRTTILNAKFVCYGCWCFALAVSNLIIGFIIGFVLDLPVSDQGSLVASLGVYVVTTLLAIPLGTCAAFLALAGKGYLSPLAFVCLTIVVGQIIGALGFATYFPWAIPGLFSMSSEYRNGLQLPSYVLLVLTGIAGYAAALWWWGHTDQQ